MVVDGSSSQPGDCCRIVNVDQSTFKSEVLCSARPVLVEFWAPWSKSCQVFASVVQELTTVCGEAVKIVKVNADDNPELSLGYEIQSIPTLLYLVRGELKARIVGTASKTAILAKLHLVPPGA